MEGTEEFLERRAIYCRNQCNFQIQTLEELVFTPKNEEGETAPNSNQELRQTIKSCMYCTGCGLVEDVLWKEL